MGEATVTDGDILCIRLPAEVAEALKPLEETVSSLINERVQDGPGGRVAICWTDTTGIIQYMNEACRELLQAFGIADPEAIVGTRDIDLWQAFQPTLGGEYNACLADRAGLVESEQPITTTRILTSGERRHLLLSTRVQDGDRPLGYLSVIVAIESLLNQMGIEVGKVLAGLEV